MQSAVPPQARSEQEPELEARSVLMIRELAVPRTAPPYDDEPAAADGWDQPYQSGISRAKPPGSADGGAAKLDPWPRQFAQALAETLAGVRPAHQLTQWTNEQARRQIRQLGPLLAGGQLPRVRRIMTSAPAADTLEVTAVVACGERVRVLAVRLERDPAGVSASGGGWCCTAVESA